MKYNQAGHWPAFYRAMFFITDKMIDISNCVGHDIPDSMFIYDVEYSYSVVLGKGVSWVRKVG